MKRMHKIILCFTLLSVLICTTVFSASASYVASERPRESIIRSIVETNSGYAGGFYYYDYGTVNFEDNDFSGQPLLLTMIDESSHTDLGYQSYERITQFLVEGSDNELLYDLDSWVDADQITRDFFIHSVEFNLNDFAIGINDYAMEGLECYVALYGDVVDACYFDGVLRFPYTGVYEVYAPDGDYYDIDAGVRDVNFEFFPYQSNEYAQPFVEVGKTIFTDFNTGVVLEYDSLNFTDACRRFFADAYGITGSKYASILNHTFLVGGCYRMEFGGEELRDTTSMVVTSPYLNEQLDYYTDSFPLPFVVEEVQVEPFDWLLQSGQTALDFELLPNITVGHLLLVILAIPILVAVLRLIAGG